MESINSVTLSGRISNEPVIRGKKDDDPKSGVCVFGLAFTRNVKRNDEWTEEVGFIDCIAFNGTGRMIEKKAKKGSLVTLSGALRFESWNSQEGTKRQGLKLAVSTVVGEFVFTKSEGNGEGQ